MNRLGDIWGVLDKKRFAKVTMGIAVVLMVLLGVVVTQSRLSLDSQVSRISYEDLEVQVDFDRNRFNPSDFSGFVKEIKNDSVGANSLEYNDFKLVVNQDLTIGLGKPVNVSGFYPVSEIEFRNNNLVFARDKGNNYTIGLVKYENQYWVCSIAVKSEYLETPRGVQVGDSKEEMLSKMGGIPNTIDSENDSEVFIYEFKKFCIKYAVKYGQVQEIQFSLNCY